MTHRKIAVSLHHQMPRAGGERQLPAPGPGPAARLVVAAACAAGLRHIHPLALGPRSSARKGRSARIGVGGTVEPDEPGVGGRREGAGESRQRWRPAGEGRADFTAFRRVCRVRRKNWINAIL